MKGPQLILLRSQFEKTTFCVILPIGHSGKGEGIEMEGNSGAAACLGWWREEEVGEPWGYLELTAALLYDAVVAVDLSRPQELNSTESESWFKPHLVNDNIGILLYQI